MKKYLLFFYIVSISHCFAQINYVINPSFEVYSSCPSSWGHISFAIGWDTLRNGGGINPDFYHSCCTGYCGVPINWWSNSGFQYPKTGNGYTGLIALDVNPQLRELIQGTLVKILIINNDYCVKAYINLSNFSKYSINSLGFILDDGQISCTWNTLPNIIPQVYHTGFQLSDTTNWMRIEGVFTANGTEEYISIGNFFPDSLSSPVLFNPSGAITTYYYIDDVSVIDANLPAYAGNDTLIQQGDSVFIGRQPEIGLDEDCIWLVNGVPLDTVAGLWVQPDTTTTYIVQQTICGNVQWDTVTVSVDTGVGMDGAIHRLPRGFEVYPNPSNGTFTISLKNSDTQVENIDIRIYNLIGKQVSSLNLLLENNSAILSVDLNNGIYFLTASDANGLIYNSKKILVIR